MAKRVFDSAFTSSAPGGMPVTVHNGFDAPSPQLPPRSPSPLDFSPQVPGRWPRDEVMYDNDQGYEYAPASFLTTIGHWAATVAIPHLLSLPVRLAQRFLRRQKIIVQPIVREDGARKKRIISAGLAEEPSTPSPSQRARINIARRRQASKITSPDIWESALKPTSRPAASDVAALVASPDIRIPTLSPVTYFQAPLTPAHHEQLHNSETVDDDSLDFSMDDAISGTPLIPQSASPSPRSNKPGPVSPIRFRGLGLPKSTPNDGASKFSPNTHRRIIKGAPITPARKNLIKNLLAQHDVTCAPAQVKGDHTEPIARNQGLREPSALQAQAIQLSLLSKKAQEIAEGRQAKAKALEEQEAEDRRLRLALHNAEFNVRETIDEDLSFLPNASDDDILPESSSEFDDLLDERSDQTLFSPSPFRPRKEFRWSSHANVKEFYFDEKVSEMLDSTLESILSCPRPREEVELEFEEDPGQQEEEEDGADVDGPELSFIEPSSESDDEAKAGTIGFTGVPPETFEDSEDFLEESEISQELLQELQEELQKKLALEPPAPPPVQVKDLVTPLSPQELDEIKAVAQKTENGTLRKAWIIEEKVTAYDFSTLLPHQFSGSPRAWLNDNIVNEYLAILVKEKKQKVGFESKRGGPAPPLHIFSSFWYTTAKNKIQGVERWAGRFQLAGKKYLDADLVMYPICDKGHWRLLVVKPKERSIEYLDSMGFDGSVYVKKMQEYLAMELKDLYIADEWTVVKDQRSVAQVNGSDCGVFTILNALALMRGEDIDRIMSNDGMKDARERIALTLIKGVSSTELE